MPHIATFDLDGVSWMADDAPDSGLHEPAERPRADPEGGDIEQEFKH